MGDKPDVVGPDVLVNIDQNQDAGHKNAEQDISPLRNGVYGIKVRKQKKIYKQHDTRHE